MAKTIEQLVDASIDYIVAANPGCRVHIRMENVSGREVQHEGYLSVYECSTIEALAHHVEPIDESGIVRLVIEF